ncbi:MAG TPA: hypothetical protein VHC69_34985 [Polyangiaceae bacterium]|nr:hypothetical protein [Polyangiaceae bacterium]
MGLEELRLLYDANMLTFPPRLPEQPIFYPVTNEPYARQIAANWNTKSGTRSGFVTRFEVDSEYAARFQRKVVGGREHEELWVPADELDGFNRHIKDRVRVIGANFGEGYVGLVPDGFALGGMDASEQFIALARALTSGSFDIRGEIAANHVAVFLNFFFWEVHEFSNDGFPTDERDRVLAEFRQIWSSRPRVVVPLGVAQSAR